MAVVFGIEQFHQYIYAKEVTVETDHRFLVSIISKPLMQHYHINLQYKPGKELFPADTLSRAHLPNAGDEDQDLVLCVHQAVMRLPVSDKKLTELRVETSSPVPWRN